MTLQDIREQWLEETNAKNVATLHRLMNEHARLIAAVTEARDLLAQAYSDDEDNDSPGNMAYALLNAALSMRPVPCRCGSTELVTQKGAGTYCGHCGVPR